MNTGRILAGGLVAGLASNVLGIGFVGLVVGEEMSDAMQRFDVHLGAGDAVLHAGLRLSYGLLVVWLYAALRPRLGPGPRTALAAAFVVWWAMVPLLLLNLYDFRIYPPWVVAAVGAWSLIEMSLVSLLGAWIYREPPSA